MQQKNKVNLFINYFSHNNFERKQEIDTCIRKNIVNPFIDTVYILNESNVIFDYPKVVNITSRRLLYRTIFEASNKLSKKTDINILCNLDIVLPVDLSVLFEVDFTNKIAAITRWDIVHGGNLNLFDVPYAQDTWIWKGHIDLGNFDLRYNLGVPGCDNALVAEFHLNGYNVVNPAKCFITQHYHLSQLRDYTNDDKLTRKFWCITPSDSWDTAYKFALN